MRGRTVHTQRYAHAMDSLDGAVIEAAMCLRRACAHDYFVRLCSMGAMRSACWTALETLRMPSTRNEEYRYTDISPLLKSSLTVP